MSSGWESLLCLQNPMIADMEEFGSSLFFPHPLSLASLLPQKLLGEDLGWQRSTKSQGDIYLFNAMLYFVILVKKMVILFHLELL